MSIQADRIFISRKCWISCEVLTREITKSLLTDEKQNVIEDILYFIFFQFDNILFAKSLVSVKSSLLPGSPLFPSPKVSAGLLATRLGPPLSIFGKPSDTTHAALVKKI